MRGMRDGKLTNMSMDINPKQYKKPCWISAVDKDKYNLQVMEWKENTKIHIKSKRHMNEGNQKLCAILIDQSSPEMFSKLEGKTGHNKFKSYQYGISLLAMVKNIMLSIEDYLHKTVSIIMAEKMLHTFWQNPNVENDNYKIHLNTYVTVLEAYAGRITVQPDLEDGKIRELYPSLSDPKNALSHQREATPE